VSVSEYKIIALQRNGADDTVIAAVDGVDDDDDDNDAVADAAISPPDKAFSIVIITNNEETISLWINAAAITLTNESLLYISACQTFPVLP